MATRSSRFGIVGSLSLALLVGIGALVFVRVTSQAGPTRRCAGGAAAPTGVADADPVAAIRMFAPKASSPAFVVATVGTIPDDGWVQRSDTLFEHGIDGDRVLQLDVAPSDGRSTVVGLWLCSPIAG
jgi:hypothetical protein